MTSVEKTPLYRSDDKELLGYIVNDGAGWQAQTIFGYTIERTLTRRAAENTLRERGLSFLMGVWQYYDTDDKDWFPCILKEAHETRVTVIRTNVMGYQDPDDYKFVVIQKPTETRLIKSS